MSGLFALLDDVAAIAKLAAASVDDVAAATGKASAKAAGVVVDDTAVTPQYLQGLRPEQELPIIKRIALGSLRNKILIILPGALLLSYFAPFLLPPLMILGGSYLAFEGMEKVIHHFAHRKSKHSPTLQTGKADQSISNSTMSAQRSETVNADQKIGTDNINLASSSSTNSSATASIDNQDNHAEQVVKNAVRTDLILSAEIMIIALNEITAIGLLSRTIVLIIVAFLITFLVYGVVAILVKTDDFGLALTRRNNPRSHRIGATLVSAMPKILRAIGIIGTFAMIWVGGHILITSCADLGWHTPHHLVTSGEEYILESLSTFGTTGSFSKGLFTNLATISATLFETGVSLIIGAIWGGFLAFLTGGVKKLFTKH